MFKGLLKFRIWHLLLLIALVAVGLWAVTQYGMESAVFVVEKFHVAKKFDNEHANLHLKIRVEQPPLAKDVDPVVDCALFWAPLTMLPNEVAEGDVIRFRYRKKPVWIGIGRRTFWEARSELMMDKFWYLLLEVPEDRALTKREQKALDQVLGSVVP